MKPLVQWAVLAGQLYNFLCYDAADSARYGTDAASRIAHTISKNCFINLPLELRFCQEVLCQLQAGRHVLLGGIALVLGDEF